jgi:Flp pilus assembly pilin Flp
MDVLQEVGHETDQHGRRIEPSDGGANMSHLLRKLWRQDEGQDIAEYAVMLAVILVLVVGTIRLIGSNANNVFSSAASSIQ